MNEYEGSRRQNRMIGNGFMREDSGEKMDSFLHNF